MSQDENLTISNTFTESKERLLKQDLTKTPEKIAEHLNIILNRTEDIGNGFKNSKTIIDKIKESETKVLNYARQLKTFKDQLENDKIQFEKEIKTRQTALENDIVDIAKQLADLQTNRSNIETQQSKYQNEKELNTQIINDMHGMDDDLIKEEQEIVDRISFCQTILDDLDSKNPEFEITKMKEEITTTELMTQNVQESIINMSQQIEVLKAGQMKFQDEAKTTQEKIIATKKSPHIPLLKRSLSIQNEEFSLYDQERKKFQAKINQSKANLNQAHNTIVISKETRKQCLNDKEKYKNIIDLTQKQIIGFEEDANQLSKSNQLMKQCKTIKEFKLMQKIIETKNDKINILHEIGEIKVISKDQNKKLPEMNIKLNHLEEKMKKADEAQELIHLVELKIKNNENQIKNQAKEDEEKFKIALNTLRQLNDHIAFSEKVQSELSIHHFSNPSVSDIIIEPTIKERILTAQLHNIRKSIKTLTRKINHKIDSKVKKQNLITCPLFTHKTEINQFEEEKIHERNINNLTNTRNTQKRKKINMLLSNDDLDSLIYYHQHNIMKRRLELIERKKRMESVCDYYADQSTDDIACNQKQFCNSGVKLTHREHCNYEELFLKIIAERNKWQKALHGTSQMLISWNNQVEHML